MNQNKYHNIRPYTDQEIKSALVRMSKEPALSDIFSYLFEDKDPESLRRSLTEMESVNDFQVKIMAPVIQSIAKLSTGGVTYSGLENILRDNKNLLISNHRDIILDPAFLQIIYHINNLPTTEIAVGDNLITSTFIEDIIRSNRMIKVLRSNTAKELYESSKLLSEYIRESITSNHASIWIAQRNGRTKDGCDTTEQGVLKMLDMSGEGNFVENFSEINILPVSISYQIEPCDFLKAREIYITKREKYIKKPGEDLNSILTGVKQDKGMVHYHFCSTLQKEQIEKISRLDKNDRFKSLALLIDRNIIQSYRLWDTNYIAYDIVTEGNKYELAGMYSQKDRTRFLEYYNWGLDTIEDRERGEYEYDRVELEKIYLSIYANPVFSKEADAENQI